MRDNSKAMLKSVKEICEKRGPLLLALSGGPDSMALFHLLKESQHPFEVAHIDHGWREESREEATYLQSVVDVPFHLKKLQKAPKNLEDVARKERLAFYKEVLEKRKLGGVLLAHHADDLAETVLKRIFEGARLTKLVGLEKESVVDGILLLRPLLDFRKKQILSYLKDTKYFVDPTNMDLRSRMRRDILPLLTEHFGKEIVPSLCRLSAYSKELCQFQDSFFVKNVVADFFEDQRVAVSRPTLENICRHLEQGSCHKVMRIGKQEVRIHRGGLQYNKRIDEE